VWTPRTPRIDEFVGVLEPPAPSDDGTRTSNAGAFATFPAHQRPMLVGYFYACAGMFRDAISRMNDTFREQARQFTPNDAAPRTRDDELEPEVLEAMFTTAAKKAADSLSVPS
jgi:hypothetical protein